MSNWEHDLDNDWDYGRQTDYANMSGDRINACRVFDGEVMKLNMNIAIAKNNDDVELVQKLRFVRQYLKWRIDRMVAKGYDTTGIDDGFLDL